MSNRQTNQAIERNQKVFNEIADRVVSDIKSGLKIKRDSLNVKNTNRPIDLDSWNLKNLDEVSWRVRAA